jgi:hypothetical protein
MWSYTNQDTATGENYELFFVAFAAGLFPLTVGRYWSRKFGRCDADFKASLCQQYINGFDWVLKCVCQCC